MIDAIGTLSAYSFIDKRPADQALDLHQLVHLASRNWVRMEDALAVWTARAATPLVTKLDETFPLNEPKNRILLSAYLSHVRHVLKSNLIEDNTEGRVQLLENFGLCLLSDGRNNEAEDPLTQVMETREKMLGQEHPSTFFCMSNLASTYLNQGRWKEAEGLFCMS